MARPFNKSGKTAKKIRTKTGLRTYWVQTNKKQGGRVRNAGPQAPQKPGFLRRNAGKLAVGAALLGVAALNRHKIAGAIGGARLGAAMHKESGEQTSRALAMFRGAKQGFLNHAADDRFVHGVHQRAQAAGEGANRWRKGVGAELTHHLASVGGEAAASHLGSRFGQVAGTAVGGLVAGPTGAALGGFLGGHAGNFLALRHGRQHIESAALYAGHRMSGASHADSMTKVREHKARRRLEAGGS